jgi:ATP-dependent RNA helicase DDX47/RRP3
LQKKLPEYPSEEDTVLVLLERVNEAQRLAARELRELQAQDPKANRKKKRREAEADGGVVSTALQESARPNQRGADKSGREKRHKKK